MNRRTVLFFCIPALLAVAFGPVTASRIAESWESRVLVSVAPLDDPATLPTAAYAVAPGERSGWDWGNAPRPAQRDEHTMGYDEGMLRASLVGLAWADDEAEGTGLDSVRLGPIRQRAESYDANRVVVVLFNADGTSTETRTFDGQSWTLHRVPGPPPRSLPATVYDPARKTVVLFTAGYVAPALALGGDMRAPIIGR